MKSRTLAVIVLLFAPTLLFGLSQKYKDWAASPQAYFMTKAERVQWGTVVTDADAEKFVNEYLAKRGPGFAEQVADRVANADKYLTIGKTKPASQTLRGKVIVLLGPPSAVKTENKRGRVDRYTPVGGYGDMTGGSPGAGGGGAGGQGASVGDMMAASQQTGMSGTRSYVEYTITYGGENLPAAYAKGVSIKVQADPGTGEDWVSDRNAQAKLDELFAAVAEARVTPKP